MFPAGSTGMSYMNERVKNEKSEKNNNSKKKAKGKI